MIHPLLAQVNQYYVWENCFRDRKEPRIFVTKDEDRTQYLHSDGMFRGSTQYESKYTGYFATVEKAKVAINLFNSLNGLS